MRKLLIALTCLALFGACSREDAGPRTEGEPKGFALVFANDSSGVTVMERPVTVFDLAADEGGFAYVLPEYFEAGEPIELKDVDRRERQILAFSGLRSDQLNDAYLEGEWFTVFGNEIYPLEQDLSDVFCGVTNAATSEAEGTIVMRRISGGLQINVVNIPAGGWTATVELENPYLASLPMGSKTLRMELDQRLGEFEAGKVIYLLPLEPVDGRIYLTRTDESGVEERNEFTFSIRGMTPNRVLSVDVTLEANSAARSMGGGVAKVTREELIEM